MKLENLKRTAGYEAGMQLETVRQDANHIIDNMNRILQRIGKDGMRVNLNSLGELQAQGVGFDVQVATFCEKQRILERLENLDQEEIK